MCPFVSLMEYLHILLALPPFPVTLYLREYVELIEMTLQNSCVLVKSVGTCKKVPEEASITIANSP